MQLWRINTCTRTAEISPLPASWERLGGRGLAARILLDEVPPACDPLGPYNKLVLAPGLLVGHGLSSCDRLSAGAKSPLTGGIKESNAGGKTGGVMGAMGIRALILEDQPQDADWWVLRLSADGAEFIPAEQFGDELIGHGVYAGARTLVEACSKRAAILMIGPGGEMGLRAAGLCNIDPEGNPTRINARGGLGAVLGSKRLKAILFEPGPRARAQVADPAAVNAGRRELVRIINVHPIMAGFREFGTAGIASMTNYYGAMPTRNYAEGRFEEIESINGEALRDVLTGRGGASRIGHQCMAGCAIRCSNVLADEAGEEIVGPLEFETIGLVGSNLGIGSLDEIGRLNRVINDLGLDTIEVGAALGVAGDAGLMAFGDASSAAALLQEIQRATPLGRVLGNGAATTGRVFNVRRVTAVKGQAISAYDPRAIKGTGVTYATSPQGGDHTAGLTIRAKVDHLDPQGQVELSRKVQINVGGYDTLGACLFAGYVFAEHPELAASLLNGIYGWEVDDGILQELGRTTLSLEREFNRRAGFTPADDRLPEWMTQEANPSTGSVFDVPEAELDELFNWD
jgi:aldehyde:ferredoxin oxidoreductase